MAHMRGEQQGLAFSAALIVMYTKRIPFPGDFYNVS